MSDYEEEVGLDDWRQHKPYGVGYSRKRINFVKAGSAPATPSTTAIQSSTTTDVSSFYLNLVLGSKTTPSSPSPRTQVTASGNGLPSNICDICSLPILDPMAVKLKPKLDTAGLGIKTKNKGKSTEEGTKVVKKRLDAKSARKEAEKEKARMKAFAHYLNRP
ncbi:hypothetical protein BDZ91DRAFT_731795 [Kalaharituber pfeilii]|nr:hypothetical protein BDZ91DRAFT_731795 [Kalaharituber pfeilii]